ncbi:hypothetical protein GALMADRAFT_699410 [Galerina marginata CBS 339.88]|uniref:RNase III domain-containing protein n=1 Tax=Galerina marginata (strain CBS 339.88) TaxID=685588 RepID=A0A067TLU0_GALM3|nr:hypothetical protein GALMADRAFT_699410 [Galerina marginata CBS 339.88]
MISDASLVRSSRPDFGKDDCLFPPLPQILSPTTHMQVFTHRSFFARAAHVFEDPQDDLSPDNEKFEHLGDSVLQTSITTMLMEHFPGLRVGPATKIRSMIVANVTLAQISLKYRLPDYLRLHPAQAITLRASTNIRANVFEAFVGGLFIDQGLDAVNKWVVPLFKPYAIAAYRIAREQHGLPAMPPSFCTPNHARTDIAIDKEMSSPGAPHPEPTELSNMPTIGHLALFNQFLQKMGRQTEWIYSDGNESPAGNGYSDVGLPPDVLIKGTKVTPVWYVKVMVDGQFHGRGRGNTKKAARNEAAKEGLSKLGIEV